MLRMHFKHIFLEMHNMFKLYMHIFNQRTNGPVNAHLSSGIYTNKLGHIHVYSPRAGTDAPLGSILFSES